MGELDDLRARIAELEGKPAPMPKGLSRARYLHETSQRRGVTTQWLKDLGYTAHDVGEGRGEDGCGWELEAPDVPKVLQHMAESALHEVLASATTIERPDGSLALELPSDSWRWVARVAGMWREIGALDSDD